VSKARKNRFTGKRLFAPPRVPLTGPRAGPLSFWKPSGALWRPPRPH